MSNIDIYKEYIQDSIINHLERLMGNDVGGDVNQWEKYGSRGLTPQKDSVYRSNAQTVKAKLGDKKTTCDQNVLLGTFEGLLRRYTA